jgi:hypothetical protein
MHRVEARRAPIRTVGGSETERNTEAPPGVTYRSMVSRLMAASRSSSVGWAGNPTPAAAEPRSSAETSATASRLAPAVVLDTADPATRHGGDKQTVARSAKHAYPKSGPIGGTRHLPACRDRSGVSMSYRRGWRSPPGGRTEAPQRGGYGAPCTPWRVQRAYAPARLGRVKVGPHVCH